MASQVRFKHPHGTRWHYEQMAHRLAVYAWAANRAILKDPNASGVKQGLAMGRNARVNDALDRLRRNLIGDPPAQHAQRVARLARQSREEAR